MGHDAGRHSPKASCTAFAAMTDSQGGMVGSSHGRWLAWLASLVVSCVVASGEVHAQETTSTLVEALADHMEGAQPSRDQFTPAPRRGANVMGAVAVSFRLLTMQHAIRIGFQEKTRRELGGPFLKDYANSIRMPQTWGDGDGWVVNYLGHPSQGATSGWVWINNDPGAEQVKLGLSKRYWTSRARALAWSAAYSTQFEIGPYSEASIGNVGLDPATTGWTDYVTTPLGGFAMIIAEDAIDQHFLVWLERRTRYRPLRAIYRSFATPNRSMANLASGRWPWHREGRPLGETGLRPRNEFLTTQAPGAPAPRGTAIAIGAPVPEGVVIPER